MDKITIEPGAGKTKGLATTVDDFYHAFLMLDIRTVLIEISPENYEQSEAMAERLATKIKKLRNLHYTNRVVFMVSAVGTKADPVLVSVKGLRPLQRIHGHIFEDVPEYQPSENMKKYVDIHFKVSDKGVELVNNVQGLIAGPFILEDI